MLILWQAGGGGGKGQLELQCNSFLWHSFLTSPGASPGSPSQSSAPLSLRSHSDGYLLLFFTLPYRTTSSLICCLFFLITLSQLHLLLISSTDTTHVEVTIMSYLSCNYHFPWEEDLPSLLHSCYIHSLTDLQVNLKRDRENLGDLGFLPFHKHFSPTVPLHPS